MAFFLKVLKGPDSYLSQTYELQYDLLTIGREVGNDVVIVERSVSRFHCNLWWEDDAFMIEDLGSTNGTFINGKPIKQPYRLSPGDLVSLGSMVTIEYMQGEKALRSLTAASTSAAFDKTISDIREIQEMNANQKSTSTLKG